MPLCGHATLASAWVVYERLDPGRHNVVFHTTSGILSVQRIGDRFVKDFPARKNVLVETPALEAALGCALNKATRRCRWWNANISDFLRRGDDDSSLASSRQTAMPLQRRARRIGGRVRPLYAG